MAGSTRRWLRSPSTWRRDSWTPPAWAFEPHRYAQPWWFVSGPSSLRAMALVQSPLAFRKRGVFICDGDLTRV